MKHPENNIAYIEGSDKPVGILMDNLSAIRYSDYAYHHFGRTYECISCGCKTLIDSEKHKSVLIFSCGLHIEIDLWTDDATLKHICNSLDVDENCNVGIM